MEKQNVNLDFSLKKTDSRRNYLLEEIKHNDLMSENIRNCVGLSFEKFSCFCFSSQQLCFNFCICLLVSVPVGVASSTRRIKIRAITAGIKKYK